MQDRPVIFLAFANDREDYLYKLTEEQNAIRQALRPVEKEGLCEVVYETDTDLDKIWNTFNEYQDRIVLFHYGGHAEDYTMLLHKASGERQFASGEGLVPFLAQQRGLKMVFINGCSSRRQAQELRDQGVPAVVGTSEPINDEAATILSGAFYRALAAGRSLEQAWLGAKDLVLSQKKKEGFHRGIKLKDTSGQYISEFPWELYIRTGAEQVKQWNLPKAARNPLFSLPLPEEAFLRLPDIPYVGLHYFREEDAAVFFGRGAEICDLHNHIQGVHPIILLYGESGVGKSSILDAGLLPRIKHQYQITYVRRLQDKGLLGTLDLALDELLGVHLEATEAEERSPEQHQSDLQLLRRALEAVSDKYLRQEIESLLKKAEKGESKEVVALSGILKKWQDIESRGGQPLIVILDQVEEKFTRPMPGSSAEQTDELLDFLIAIQPLFSVRDSGIQGKIILSYRKEYHPEIRDAFHALHLPYAEVFLKRLDRQGIIEAIGGVTRFDQIENGVIRHNIRYNPYRLELENSTAGNLPEIIADELLEDTESPIAPILQLIMEKLWKTALKKDGEPVRLSISQYQELRKQGTTMEEFFRAQMSKLRTEAIDLDDRKRRGEIAEALQSGLVLDLLHAHTTVMGTSGSCRRSVLLQRYEVEDTILINLLDELQRLSLLLETSTEDSESGTKEYTTYLAHDTLAPVVIMEYNLSDAPGQRARRTLNNKMADVGFSNDPGLIAEWRAESGTLELTDQTLKELEKAYTGLNKFLAANEQLLGSERFVPEKERLLARAQLSFRDGDREILLEDTDLMIVETGAGLKEGTFPGMCRLSRPESVLLERSLEQREQRLEAARKAREERERLVRAELAAEQDAKRQAEEKLEVQRRVAGRQRLFSVLTGIAFILALMLSLWALQERQQLRQNLQSFQKAMADEVRKEVLDLLDRVEALDAEVHPQEAQLLLDRARRTLDKHAENPQLQGLSDTVNLRLEKLAK